jgi:AcrR family transcriptional regulator
VPKVSAEHKQAVRERLLDAAHECLHERGYDAVTTREILDRAGLSAGTLYHYFSGKDDLMMALAERVAAVELPELLGVGDGHDLAALTRVVRAILTARGDTLLPELRSRARVDPHVRKALARYDSLLVEGTAPLVERAQLEGHVDPSLDAAALVELVELVFEAVQAHLASGMFVTSIDRVADTFVSLLSKGGAA